MSLRLYPLLYLPTHDARDAALRAVYAAGHTVNQLSIVQALSRSWSNSRRTYIYGTVEGYVWHCYADDLADEAKLIASNHFTLCNSVRHFLAYLKARSSS